MKTRPNALAVSWFFTHTTRSFFNMNIRYLAPFALVATCAFAQAQQKLELKPNDHIAIVGSGLADRQQHHAWLETMIHRAFPDLDLTVRNLGFATDEVNLHPRSDEVPPTEYFLNMKPGDLTTKVGNAEVTYKAGSEFHAGVILAYWGFNESFRGAAGVEEFKKNLAEYLRKHLDADYGAGHPRLVLLLEHTFES